ncbi:hypothetical protein D0258_004444 [Vibrio alginolyticus]
MINIYQHIRSQGIINPELEVRIHAQKIWDSLNPTLSNNSKIYKKSSLIGRLEKSIKKINSSDKNFIYNHCDNNKSNALVLLKYLNYLKADNYKKLKETIISNPEKLEKLMSEAKDYLPDGLLFNYTNNGVKQTGIGKFLSNTLFNYTNYRSKEFSHNFFKEIGFDSATCPYCNESKVKIVKKRGSSNKTKLLFHIDHFYPKSIFPYFSLSIYNHIPSCDSCNTSYKRDNIFIIKTHVHPYHESFHDIYTFKLDINDIQSGDIKSISVVNKGIKPTDITLSDLEIEERYNERNIYKKSTALIKTYKYYSHYLKDPNLRKVFLDMVYNCHGVPEDDIGIMDSQYGKLLRDIISSISDNHFK